MTTSPGHTLVTGASSGIGRAVAIHLSRQGPLVLHGRDAARLEETRALCARPDEHRTWVMDLADVDGLEAGLTPVLAACPGGVTRFVQCAGMLGQLPIRLMRPDKAREVMNVNFASAAEITRLLVKKTLNPGALTGIVFVSSTASEFGAKGFSLYCASKGALDALMRALAVELAPAVRVNSVLPGGVRTAMTEHMFQDPQLAGRLDRDYPLGLGQPGDIADAVEFLLSDRARWITGHQLVVDGGRTANISA